MSVILQVFCFYLVVSLNCCKFAALNFPYKIIYYMNRTIITVVARIQKVSSPEFVPIWQRRTSISWISLRPSYRSTST